MKSDGLATGSTSSMALKYSYMDAVRGDVPEIRCAVDIGVTQLVRDLVRNLRLCDHEKEARAQPGAT